MAIRVVTLEFLVEGGDGYPFSGFVAANPGFANRVDLKNETIAEGHATFAPAGTEQDALAEYLQANFRVNPFNEADADPGEDLRIQNLEFRDDTVLDGIGRIDLTGTGDNSLTLDIRDLLDLSDDTEGGVTILRVFGDAGDRVTTADSGWTRAADEVEIDGQFFAQFDNGNARLLIDSDVTVDGIQA